MTYFSELDPFEPTEKEVGGGFILKAEIKPDDGFMAPWEMDDFTPKPYTKRYPYSEHKAPSEYKLVNGDFVDFRDLVLHERKAGGCSKEQAHKNALSVIKRLNAWLNNEWHYCGVVVRLIHPATVGELERESLWGIESNSDESYLLQTANELADELMSQLPELAKEECDRLKRESAMLEKMIEIHDKEAAQ